MVPFHSLSQDEVRVSLQEALVSALFWDGLVCTWLVSNLMSSGTECVFAGGRSLGIITGCLGFDRKDLQLMQMLSRTLTKIVLQARNFKNGAPVSDTTSCL